ncbi:hypothetical protein EDC01DRAFT_667688 [Geopyxis carbonaria]|nr:hypothetical protein EDC01DRAFT_667688 [Geopyxis carbonaria]
MNFFRKVFRSKKRNRSHTNPAGEPKNGYAAHDLRMSRDDSYLHAPPRFPDSYDSRPMTAPSSPGGGAAPYNDWSSYPPSHHGHASHPPAGRHSRHAATLPAAVLANIFAFVCPHSTDRSYLPAEETTTEGGCMLCDMRDLAGCALVCRRWHAAALPAQYTSVRLDSVHYCGLEDALTNRRKRGSFFVKKQDGPVEVPELRMRLLYRTFQENEAISNTAQFLKMPYMTRETCKADLARLVSLTPALRYVDLPETVFGHGDDALRSTLLARCPELRKMAWTAGAERTFSDLARETPWPALEVATVANMQIEDVDLVRSLRALPALQDLTLRSLPWLSDGAFDPSAAPLPPLSRFTLDSITTVSLPGLSAYLSRPIVSASLTHLALFNTALTPAQLPQLLPLLPALKTLSYRTAVGRALPHPPPPPLASPALQTLHYLITPDATAAAAGRNPGDSHYAHLAASLPSLPALTRVYVRDPSFHTRLAAPAAAPPRATALTIHEKAADHQDWSRYTLSPPPSSAPGGKAELKPVWDLPRNSLVASGDVQTGFLKAAAAGAMFAGANDVLVPPSPGFAGGRPVSRGSLDAGGNYHRRTGSWASLGSVGGKKAERERRGSRQDLWR